jgi:hypothetical protein
MAKYVVCDYKAFERIKTTHLQLGHAGVNKTFTALNQRYYGITKEEVGWLVKRCQNCMVNRSNRSRPPLTPIVSTSILEPVQIDLMDFRHEHDGQFKWILHVKDHFSKYSFLFPLQSKQAEEVTVHISSWIGCVSVPRILQCDNGKEFKGVLLALLLSQGIQIISGRPRNPQT